MEITNNRLSPWQGIGRTAPSGSRAVEEQAQNFGHLLREALREVDRLQDEAEAASRAFIEGQVEDLHQVILAGEKAALALQLTVQIRNKVVEAYQELMRMQV
ncbi:MAG TPA: flagellar hook-basal body complex protein FliE [Firmicutes bacterium]|nr:flagellar hook-basal body complex protein FliE [Bacillota bacterium]